MADTIFAPATPSGRGAVSILRVSGPLSRAVVERVTGSVPEARRASVRNLFARSGEIIDEALVLFMPGPNSFSGEDMAEFQVHGSVGVMSAFLKELGSIDGLRLAERGEFTRRALFNEKIDLARAEGLADLIEAETEAQRRQALRQMKGVLGQQSELWRERLLTCLACIEAFLDFSDEADVSEGRDEFVARELSLLAAEMNGALQASHRSERIRDGLVVVLAGPPNAGKSTLLNCLAQRNVAIVSPIAGTTRDIVEVKLDLDGYPIVLCDTAGARKARNSIEREGIRRMLARAEEADLVLWLRPAGMLGDPVLKLANESVVFWTIEAQIDRFNAAGSSEFQLSAKTGEGVDRLIHALSDFARARLDQAPEAVVLTRARHREAVEEAVSSIERALARVRVAQDEFVAEDVRSAARAIGRIAGRVYVDDVLDRLFENFCIGK